jgi:hypothetical protein
MRCGRHAIIGIIGGGEGHGNRRCDRWWRGDGDGVDIRASRSRSVMARRSPKLANAIDVKVPVSRRQ